MDSLEKSVVGLRRFFKSVANGRLMRFEFPDSPGQLCCPMLVCQPVGVEPIGWQSIRMYGQSPRQPFAIPPLAHCGSQLRVETRRSHPVHQGRLKSNSALPGGTFARAAPHAASAGKPVSSAHGACHVVDSNQQDRYSAARCIHAFVMTRASAFRSEQGDDVLESRRCRRRP
jgi:hypothetical protein